MRVDLSGVNAVRFKATLGGDYPLGDESQRRKVTAIRAAGAPVSDPASSGTSTETRRVGDRRSEARFLTVIEPYEDQPMVKSAVALSADKLRVELNDGRVQEIELQNFDGDGKNIVVQLTETKDGQTLRQESTAK